MPAGWPTTRCQIVGGRTVDAEAASATQMGRFETETLPMPENRAALADPNDQWIDRFYDRRGLKHIVQDMDSSVSPTHGEQEVTTWNGHFDGNCYHRLFLFNQFEMLERCALRHGNVRSADGWQHVLDPVIARYAGRKLGGGFFRADAAYASPAIYARLKEAGYFYAIRLPDNAVLRESITHWLTRPVGRIAASAAAVPGVNHVLETASSPEFFSSLPNAVYSPRLNGKGFEC